GESHAQRKRDRAKHKSTFESERELVDNGSTLYRIVVPSAPRDIDLEAADVLQQYLLQISNAALPVLRADQHPSSFEILLGRNDGLNELNPGIDFNALGEDGFVIMTDSARLIIAGGSDKRTLYGVYTFLENYLGCRMYAPGVQHVPHLSRIVIPDTHDVQVPVI